MKVWFGLALGFLVGCGDKEVQITTRIDNDGDGYTVQVDCNDGDRAINPDAVEACDGIDNDCDGIVDEEVPDQPVFYADADRDGFGDARTFVVQCTAPPGYVEDSSDCDDFDADSYPGADELCDGVDNDCDRTIDEDFPGSETSTFYRDVDGDGYGDPAFAVTACEVPDGFADNADDCDDYLAVTHPGADERCDGQDNDCDGDVDEEAVDARTWYGDNDGDGYNGTVLVQVGCVAPAGYTAGWNDCDDDAGSDGIHPDADEACDGIDQDCDGEFDEGCSGRVAYHPDLDGDGFGDANVAILASALPAGFLDDDSDCDDTDADINPDAPEVCDFVDNNCNDLIDEAEVDGVETAGVQTFYADRDRDGAFGAVDTVRACRVPLGFSATWTDCDDDNVRVFPGAAERCNGVDDDCDGAVDEEDAVDKPVWFYDNDNDGFAGDAVTLEVCDAPARFHAAATDCNDNNPSVNPDAVEICDTIDNNCRDGVDEPASQDARTWYLDLDADGYGTDLATTHACVATAPWTDRAGDCDDANPGSHPGATEVCNNRDDDCNGEIDDDPVDPTTWYEDHDNDGHYGADHVVVQCNVPAEGDWSTAWTDCDDRLSIREGSVESAVVYPRAPERCDGRDNDCDGEIDEWPVPGVDPRLPDAPAPVEVYGDLDSDGFYGPDPDGVSRYACPDFMPTPYQPVADIPAADVDCEDGINAVNPGAAEVCDGLDNDCDTVPDPIYNYMVYKGWVSTGYSQYVNHTALWHDPASPGIEVPREGTVEMWVRLAQGTAGHLLVWPYNADPRRYLQLHSDGSVEAGWTYDTGQAVVRSGPDAVRYGEWIHLALVWEDGNLRIFADGLPVGSYPVHGDASAAGDDSGRLVSGSVVDSRGNVAVAGPANSYLAQLRISNAPLYQAPFAPDTLRVDTATTVHLWDFGTRDPVSTYADQVQGSLLVKYAVSWLGPSRYGARITSYATSASLASCLEDLP